MSLLYESIILENPQIAEDWHNGDVRRGVARIVSQPEGVTHGVPADVYGAYRKGRDSACVDIVLVTRFENGEPAVLLSLRKPDVCFGNKWWIHGGALQAYMSITDFISERATKECGVPVVPEVLIGVYRTIAEDHIGSTLQACYAARVPIQSVRQKMIADDGHSTVRLFTESEMEEIPPENAHWYPCRVAKIALRNMP